MKKYRTESFIVEIPRMYMPVLGQVLHLAKEGGIHQAEVIMKDLAQQVEGLKPNKPNIHLVYPNTLLAPEEARFFESCLYMEHKEFLP